MVQKIKQLKIFNILPWLWAAGGFIYDMWYQIFPGKWIVDSDMASEMVLANILNSTGEIISKEWFYSSELRVFQSQWFYRLGLLIFPDNWHCARIVATAVLLVVFAFVIFIFFRSIGMHQYASWGVAILMWPFGRWYLVYGLYGTYYIIYMLFSLVVMSALVSLIKRKGIKTIPIYIVGALFSFASGLNGVKQTLIFFGPLLLAVFIILGRGMNEKKPETVGKIFQVCASEIRICAWAIALIVWNVAGYFVNSKVFATKYDYEKFDSLEWAWDSPNTLYDVWMDFIQLFGYQLDAKVVSVRGVVSVLGFLFGLAIVYCIIKSFMQHKTLSWEKNLITVYVLSTLIVTGMVFCLTEVDYKDYYWLPLIPFSIVIVLIQIQESKFYMKYAKEILLVIIAVTVSLCAKNTVRSEIEEPLFGQYGYNEVADWLVENGYTQGYSLFWSSNVLREMSDGKIETWTLYAHDSDSLYAWLQEKDHFTTAPKAPYFLFINRLRGGEPEGYRMLWGGEGRLVYEKDPYYIYIFE